MLTSGEANERPIFLLLQIYLKIGLSKIFFEMKMNNANKIGAERHISMPKQ